jgi:hypothetical protein
MSSRSTASWPGKSSRKTRPAHTFYLEQSVPIPWMYPVPAPLAGSSSSSVPSRSPTEDLAARADDRGRPQVLGRLQQARLRADPKFRLDADATVDLRQAGLAWHADLYRYRRLDAEEEHWLRMTLSPSARSCRSAVEPSWAGCWRIQNRFRRSHRGRQTGRSWTIRFNETSFREPILEWPATGCKTLGHREEKELRAKLAKAALRRERSTSSWPGIFQDGGRNIRRPQRPAPLRGRPDQLGPRTAMAQVVQYYVDHRPQHRTPPSPSWRPAPGSIRRPSQTDLQPGRPPCHPRPQGRRHQISRAGLPWSAAPTSLSAARNRSALQRYVGRSALSGPARVTAAFGESILQGQRAAPRAGCAEKSTREETLKLDEGGALSSDAAQAEPGLFHEVKRVPFAMLHPRIYLAELRSGGRLKPIFILPPPSPCAR